MIEAIVLGVIQGLTEFIPVSSSAHLIIFPWLFGWKGIVNTLSFSVALHFGTLLALLLYFRRDWVDLFKTARSKNGLVWHISIATIPAAAAGFFFHDTVAAMRSPVLIVITLVFIAAIMIVVEIKRGDHGGLGLESMSRRDALFIGIAQAFALIPGVSRSGITIVAGLLRGYQRHTSARFSFLLGTPVIAAAAMHEAWQLFTASKDFEAVIFIPGITVSAVTGYIAIKFLLRFLQNHTLNPFAYYRFLLAFVIILSIFLQG
jgi:undecaprenyl-diphosphatase